MKNTNIKLIKKRALAFIIDHSIILAYMLLLLGLGLFLLKNGVQITPYSGQILGFFSLTLPVYFYFSITESSRWKGSVGKKYLKIEVKTPKGGGRSSIFLRNFIKFLPWEIAHTGVQWIIYFNAKGLEVPPWNMALLIIPQLVVLIYMASIIHSKGQGSIYDRLSGTKIQLKK